MPAVINARDISGNYFSFGVEQGRFGAVGMQPFRLPAPDDALPLDALGAPGTPPDPDAIFDARGATILPAGIDAHVHSRDPGLTHKETWATLAAGAFRGGVTTVCDMPNTIPPTMTAADVRAKAALAEASGAHFALLLGVGAGNIQQVASVLYDPTLPVCALKVFYGKTTGELLWDDLETLGRLLPRDGGKLIVFHSEDQCTVDCNHALLQGRLQERENASFSVHSEIRSSAAAHASTRAILDWAAKWGGRVHIAHISTPIEVELVAEARARGADVSCEVAPHHLLLSTDDYERLGPLAKMNPPLRSPAEVLALRQQFGQGLIDVWATDHAPHLLEEKRSEVGRSPSGVPGVELFYQLLLHCAKRFGLAPEKAVAMATSAPARLFGLTGLGAIAPGNFAEFVRLGDAPHRVRGEEVVSKCGWTPYDGVQVPRDVTGTWCRGRQVYAGAER